MDCPDDEAIAVFVDGDAPPHTAAALRAHVAACEVCAALVLEYADAFGLPSVQRSATLGTDRPREPRADGLGLTEGDLFGRFVIMMLAGRGGMGEVYLAYDPELDRNLALKIVLPRSSERDADGQRLIDEARHAASLSHPNVVAVYDVGSIDGRPFIAMEYVDGEPLSKWVEQPRGAAEILDVFEQAARGLQAAHDAGLVHRDFKPSNVLLGRDGRVRVADFGLARSLHDASGREVAGTPGYMAPEQRLGGDVDARADQYAFAVALHEALHGHRPRLHTTRRASTGSSGSPAAQISRPPRGAARRIEAALGRALATDPDERYPSMAALCQALKRPRRRAWIGGVLLGLAGIGLVAFPGVSVATAAPCPTPSTFSAELRDAVADGGPPSLDRTMVLGVASDYADALAVAAADACAAGSSAPPRVHPCLQRAGARFDSILRTAADGQAELPAVAVALRALRRPSECVDAPAGDTELQPAQPLLDAPVRRLRVELAKAQGLSDVGADALALQSLDEVMDEVERLAFVPLRAEALGLRGNTLLNLGRTQQAATTLQRAHHLASSADHPVVAAATAITLVHLYGYLMNEPELASVWGRHAEVAIERGGLETQWGELWSAQGLAAMSADEGEVAVERLLASLANRTRLFPDAPEKRIAAWTNLGVVLVQTRQSERAEPYLTQAMSAAVEAYGERHPTISTIAAVLAVCLESQRQFEAAARYHRTAIAILDDGHVQRPIELGTALNNYGMLRMTQNDPVEALVQFEHAMEVLAPLGEDDPYVGATHGHIGRALSYLARYDEAEVHQAKAVTNASANYGETHREVLAALTDLAILQRRRGDHDGAVETLTDVLRRMQLRFGSGGPDEASTRMMLGNAERQRGNFVEAKRQLTEALRLAEGAGPRGAQTRRGSLHNLALTLRDAGELDEARATIDRAIDETAAASPSHSEQEAPLRMTRGTISWQGGHADQAALDFAYASDCWRDNPVSRVRALRFLASAQLDAGQGRASAATTEQLQALVAGGDAKRALADADAWLVTHGHPSSDSPTL
ncbi:MAG: tetratricopeptide repeat protein [Myxococcota bacterium]